MNKQVFINCPFDDEYKPLLRCLLFVIHYYGYKPSLTLDTDKAALRLELIKQKIAAADYSIHDLSRIQASAADEYYRLNMPFELGLAYGLKLGGGDTGKILILEEKHYSYQKGLSDIAGMDIHSHGGSAEKLVTILHDWILTNGLSADKSAPRRIWQRYNVFQSDLADEMKARGYEYDDETAANSIAMSEYIEFLKAWGASA